MHGPARVGGALPVVPCPLCCNAHCVHPPMPWVLVLRCSRIISWPISKHFVYPSRGSCARTLEGNHQHWCAVLSPSVGWYPYSWPHIYWLDKVLKQQTWIRGSSMWTFRKFHLQPVLVKSGWIWKDTQGDDWLADTWYMLLLVLLYCYGVSLFVHLFQPHWRCYIISDLRTWGRNCFRYPCVHRYQTYWDPNQTISHQWYTEFIRWTAVVREVIGRARSLFNCVLHYWGMLCS